MTLLNRKNIALPVFFILFAIFVTGLNTRQATAQTFTFAAQADGLVFEQNPDQPYGSLPVLRVQSAPQIQSYMRFQVAGLDGPVSQATLRLYTLDAGVYNLQVYQVASNNWNEATLTYNNAPPWGNMVTTYNAAANAGEWIEINVTPTVVGNGTYTFALASNNNQRLRWQSRENDEPAQLVVLTASGSTSTPTLTPSPTPTITPTPPPPGTIVVDHNAVGLFEQIPEAYLQAAANLDMLFVDRSVGANINDGLDCLAYASDEEAPNHCTRFIHLDPAYSVDSSELNWYHAGGYDRSNWDFELWPMECDSWSDKLNCFFDMVEPQYEVVSFQYSYLEVDENSTIADMPGGFFSDNSDLYDLYDLEAYANQHPDKIIIYWTTSLARGIGTNVSESFNEQMRNYALQNNKILFDVADILAHDPQGNPCYDNRDGIPYNGENYPNDGQAIPAICPHYTTEVEGGHLGSVSAGKIRVAKAFWVLMARIAGWNGG